MDLTTQPIDLRITDLITDNLSLLFQTEQKIRYEKWDELLTHKITKEEYYSYSWHVPGIDYRKSYICDCGGQFKFNHRHTHKKSKRHISFITNTPITTATKTKPRTSCDKHRKAKKKCTCKND